MPLWYEKIITEETALDFVDQCRAFTTEYIVNYCTEVVHQWPFSTKLPTNIYDYRPEGAVVHISETPSMWNAINMMARHVYGSHFMIMAGSHNPGGGHSLESYPLLLDLPATVLMFYEPENLVPHSGFLSQRTFGVELRNTGRLRPYAKGCKPTPLTKTEENDRNFKAVPEKRYDCFWRTDMWRYPFPGPAFRWEDYFYEMPTKAQVHTLIAVLRVMHVLGGLDRRLIIPSNCVSGDIPKLPLLPWDFIRECAVSPGAANLDDERIEIFSHASSPWEGHDLDLEDESIQGEILEVSRWRGDLDDGRLYALDNGREFKLANGYARSLDYLGYDTSDCEFSLHMWAMANGLFDARDTDIYNRMNRESPMFPTVGKII